MIICTDCGLEKNESEFHSNKKRKKRCKKCHNLKFQPKTNKVNLGRFVKGHYYNEGFKKGNIPWNKGKPCSDETLKRLSELQKGRKHSPEEIEKRRQSLIKFWDKKGRISPRCSRINKEWRKKVYERDGYTCQKCYSTEKLHAHHIVPWRENKDLRFELSNGITYCASCHISIEKTGKRSWNLGKSLSDEHKKKLRDAKIGYIPWNKGIRKEQALNEIRKCKICQKEKKLTDFTKKQDWFSNTCKMCRNVNLKVKRTNNGKQQ